MSMARTFGSNVADVLIAQILSDIADGGEGERSAFGALGFIFETLFTGVPKSITINSLSALGYDIDETMLSLDDEDLERALSAVEVALARESPLRQAVFAASRTGDERRFGGLIERALVLALDTGSPPDLYQALIAYLDVIGHPRADLIAKALERSDAPDVQDLASTHHRRMA